MGYYTTVTGEITITPPLTWAEIKAAPELAKYREEYDAVLRVDEIREDTADGELVRRSCSAIVPVDPGQPQKVYRLEEHTQAFIDAYPDHEFAGHFECVGEDGDLSRLVIVGRTATRIRPVMTWPMPDGGESR